MKYVDFLNYVIDDGIEEVRHHYIHPDQFQKRDGAIKGFEECRNLDPVKLGLLLIESRKIVQQKFQSAHGHDDVPDYWYWRYRDLQIEWVCNVVSAMYYVEGKPGIIPPTARALLKAANIINGNQHE